MNQETYQVFNTITDALELMEQGRVREAADMLNYARQDAQEELLAEEARLFSLNFCLY